MDQLSQCISVSIDSYINHKTTVQHDLKAFPQLKVAVPFQQARALHAIHGKTACAYLYHRMLTYVHPF